MTDRQKLIAEGITSMPEEHRLHYLRKWKAEGRNVTDYLDEFAPPFKTLVSKTILNGEWSKEATLRRTTILVKSFMRPQCLWTLFLSIRRYYPTIKIIVVDDSYPVFVETNDTLAELHQQPNVTVVHIPFDSGLSAGRNKGVEVADTEFVVLTDDDFVFTEDTQIERLVRPVATGAVDMCGGMVALDGEIASNWVGVLNTDSKPPTGFKFIPEDASILGGVTVHSTDIMDNFFACRTNWLADRPWDEQFRITCEHVDFFLTRKKEGTCSFCWTKSVVVGHRSLSPGRYIDYRQRAVETRKELISKWGGSPHTFSRTEFPEVKCQRTEDAIKALSSRPDIVILCPGRCGSTVLVEMLSSLGWHTGEVHKDYMENSKILFLTGTQSCSAEEAQQVIDSLPKPYVVKQPRFCEQWGLWRPRFAPGTLLIFLERDAEAITESMISAGWMRGDEHSTRVHVERRLRRCREAFDAWAGPKLHVRFEDLREAVSMFDPTRGYGHGKG